MKFRSMRLSRAMLWMLVGAAPVAGFYWFQAKSGYASKDFVQAAWTDLLPAAADAAPPDDTARPQQPAGRGGLTPAQRRQRLAEFLHRQALLNPAQRQAEQQQLLQAEQMEWANFRDFASINAPLLARQLGSLSPTAPLRVSLMQRWLNMVQLRENNQSDLYDLNVSQFQHEDTVRSLTQQVRAATRNHNAAAIAEVTQRIHNEVSALVGINLNQRDLQIQNAQRLLDEAKAKWETDKQDQEQIINDKTNDILQRVQNADAARKSEAPADAPPEIVPQPNLPTTDAP